MAVKLRLMRIGKTHRPHYRVCAFDSRKPRGGQYIERIGHYDPLIEDDAKKFTIDKERAEYWISVGAQPSETVLSFLRAMKVEGLARKERSKRAKPESDGKKKKISKKALAAAKKKGAKTAARKAARVKAKAREEAAAAAAAAGEEG